MEKAAYEPTSSKTGNIFKFYFIILAFLLGFMIGEKLVEEFVLSEPVSFFDHMILSSILYVILLIFTLLYAKHTNTSNYEMGWHRSYLPKSIFIGLLATSGYLIAVIGFQIPPNYTSAALITELLLFTLLVGITEESIFRGYIQANFQRGSSQMRAVLLTGLLFAFLHIPSYIISGNYLGLFGLLSIFLIGLILGYTRVYTGNIWGVILAHATWDFYMLLFTPEITMDWTTLIPALVASLSMWGSILSSMFIAKVWIDRPTQMPGELAKEYSFKIESLIQRNERIQKRISSLQLRGVPNQEKLDLCYSEIKLDDESIEMTKKYIPEINEFNYKNLRKLMMLERKRMKYENYLKLNRYSFKKANLQAALTSIEVEIAEIKKQLDSAKPPMQLST
jgi:membrane protease YdiL (CAAX protease family)